MIYCVIPSDLADELFDKLTAYYAGDDNVKVIVDRRSGDRRRRSTTSESEQQKRMQRDRRRARIAGDTPPLDVDAG
jgi:hypothetical protein